MTQMLSVSNPVKLRFANDNGAGDVSSHDTHYIWYQGSMFVVIDKLWPQL